MSPDGDQVVLATGGYDHSIRLWQAHSGLCLRTLQHADSQVNVLDVTPDRQHLGAGGTSRQSPVGVPRIGFSAGYQHIRTYDIHSSNTNPVLNYEGLSKNVTALGFHEEGLWMYTGGEDFTARIWDTRSRAPTCQRVFETHAPVNCARLHPDQCELFVGDQGGVVYVWDLRSNRSERLVLDADVSVQHLDVDAAGRYLVAVDNEGSCYLYALRDGRTAGPERLLKFPAHERYGLKCRLGPDAGILATSSADATARIWRLADLLAAAEDAAEAPAGPPSRRRSWKTAEALPSTDLRDPDQRWVWDLAFSCDGHFLITASSDGVARLWSVASGEVKREFSGHQKALTALAFRDGA